MGFPYQEIKKDLDELCSISNTTKDTKDFYVPSITKNLVLIFDHNKDKDLAWVKEHFPKNQGSGDLSFIENLLPPDMKAYHIHSYNFVDPQGGENNRRFQGVFYWPEYDAIVNTPPIEVLKNAKSFKIDPYSKDAVLWTIWF